MVEVGPDAGEFSKGQQVFGMVAMQVSRNHALGPRNHFVTVALYLCVTVALCLCFTALLWHRIAWPLCHWDTVALHHIVTWPLSLRHFATLLLKTRHCAGDISHKSWNRLTIVCSRGATVWFIFLSSVCVLWYA